MKKPKPVPSAISMVTSTRNWLGCAGAPGHRELLSIDARCAGFLHASAGRRRPAGLRLACTLTCRVLPATRGTAARCSDDRLIGEHRAVEAVAQVHGHAHLGAGDRGEHGFDARFAGRRRFRSRRRARWAAAHPVRAPVRGPAAAASAHRGRRRGGLHRRFAAARRCGSRFVTTREQPGLTRRSPAVVRIVPSSLLVRMVSPQLIVTVRS